MSIKTKLNTLATELGWGFEYARRDFQNLRDASDFISDTLEGYGVGETILFMDPIRRSSSDFGIDEAGVFMVLTKSNHDESYKIRTDLYIDPIVAIVHGSLRNKIKCDFDVNEWRSTEVVNMFDWNADGLIVTFSLKGY